MLDETIGKRFYYKIFFPLLQGSMVAGLLGVMELLKPVHYQRLWSHLAPHPHDRKPLKDFLMRAFLVFRHLIEQDVSQIHNLNIFIILHNWVQRESADNPPSQNVYYLLL